MKKLILSLVALSLISACATPPDEIMATPTSTAQYDRMSCRTLGAEQTRIVSSLNVLNASQKQKAKDDAAVMGIGMILFWPALFALKGDKTTAPQLAVAKGQYDAIMSVRSAKGCA
jgi:hypothetical protein